MLKKKDKIKQLLKREFNKMILIFYVLNNQKKMMNLIVIDFIKVKIKIPMRILITFLNNKTLLTKIQNIIFKNKNREVTNPK